MDLNHSASSLQFGAVTLIPEERLVLKDGRPVPFTPKAFDLLEVLAANPGRLLTKEHLMQAVWPDAAVEESNLAYHVFAIRKALGESPDSDRYIETVPKRGYRFVAPVVRVDGNGGGASRGSETGIGVLEPSEETEPAVAGPTDPRHAGGGQIRPRAGVTAIASLGLAAALGLGAVAYRGLSQPRNLTVATTPVHFQDAVSGRLAETETFAVSPDGRHLVFRSRGGGRRPSAVDAHVEHAPAGAAARGGGVRHHPAHDLVSR